MRCQTQSCPGRQFVHIRANLFRSALPVLACASRSARTLAGKNLCWFGQNGQHRAVCLADDLVCGASRYMAHKADRIVNTEHDEVGPALVSNCEHTFNSVTV